MKKIRKNKKQIEKGKWSVGKTIASVIGSVAVISGVTILGVYISGGFEERVVNPQSINFDYSGLQYSNGQLEISGVESFSLTISSPTENVTKKKVALSFGEGVDYSRANGYISNKIIQVPEEVELGKAFTVRLLQKSFAYDTDGDGENDLTFNSIAGGISTLIAKSEYIQINSQSLQIAVDTPVYKITNYLVDMSGGVLEKIGANQEFKVATNFYPTESRYMFADNLNTNISNSAKREKLVLYGVTDGTNYIEMNVSENYDTSFRVGSEIVDNIRIDAYSFKDAKSQLDMLNSLNEGSLQSKYSELYGKLVSSSGENVSNPSIDIEMASASISSFDIAKAGMIITVTDGEKASIYVNGTNGVSLDAQILSTDGEVLTYLLENIALEFVKPDGSPLDMDNIEIGGRELGENKFLIIDGHNLYLPYNNVSNKNNCYWDITSSLTQDIKVNVYLVVENAEGQVLFGTDGNAQVKSFTLHTKEVEDEIPSFVDQDVNFNVPQEVVTLDIASGGTGIVPKTIDLRQFIVLPANNKYRSVQFFVKANNGALITDIINGPFNGEEDGWTKLLTTSDSITIKGAGSFELKFATTKPDGTIVKNCEASKTFVCQQALSQDSIEAGKTDIRITQGNLTVARAQAYLTQMENDKIEISFALASASSSVFANEFNSGKITLSVFAGSKDITNNFSIVASPVTTNSKILNYTLTILGEPDSEMEITRFALVYAKDSTGENNISWNINVPLTTGGVNGAKIYIYSPTTSSLEIASTAPKNVSYNQSLTVGGDLEQTIINTDTSAQIIGDLVQTIIGRDGSNLTIKDQHGRTDTLAGKWAFELIKGTDAINLESQNFSIKGNGEISIKIKATKTDGSAIYATSTGIEYQLNILSSSTGVDHLEYQSGKKSNETNFVSGGEVLSRVTVEKYGKKDATYAFANLVKYYLDKDGEKEYTKVAFKFASTYFLGLTDAQIVDLYGDNGMLEIRAGDNTDVLTLGNDADTIKKALEGKEITSIRIKNDFGRNHTIKLEITDKNNVVNTSFTFNILNNLEISADDYDDKYCMAPFALTNQISYKDANANNTTIDLKNSYNGTWYIVPETAGSGYFVSSANNNAVGEIVDGQIKFYDFFDEESKSYIVSFNESNLYERNLSISFTVLRNVVISGKNQPFYIIGNADSGIGNYLSIERKDKTAGILSFDNFEFSTSKIYLKVENNVLISQNNIKFGYKEEKLTEVLTVKSGNTILGSVDVSVELANFISNNGTSITLYSQLAEIIEDAQKDSKGNVQVIDGITYIVLNTGIDGTNLAWKLNADIIAGVASVMIDGYPALYETDTTNIYLKSQAQTLAGYKDRNYYLAIKITSGTTTIKVNVPVILSKVGVNPIAYENLGDKTLARTLMSASELQANNTMLVCQAGQIITLDKFSKFKSGQTIVYDSIGAELLAQSNLQVDKNILKNLGIEKNEGCPTISLNHLSTEYGNIYLPIAWTVGDATFYYLVLVEPDVKVSDAIYAFDGDAEYISCDKDGIEIIDFDKEYSATTLHSGETRFEVYNLKDNTRLTDLNPEYFIKSVIYGTNEFSNETQWKSIVNISIDGHKVEITPKTDNPMTILIGVRFVEGANDTLSVISEEKTYTVVLNQNTSNYKVRIGDLEMNSENEYSWTISNVNGGTRDLKIELLDASDSGSLSTIVYGLLQVQEVKDDQLSSGAIKDAKYNATRDDVDTISATTLRLTLNDYINENKTIKFAVFTKYGSLATLKVTITANAMVQLKEGYIAETLKGGSTTAVSNIFEVFLNGEVSTNYSISNISFKAGNDGNGVVFASWNEENKGISIGNLFDDTAVTMTATLQFNGNAKQTYKFSQNFILKKNVKLKSTLPSTTIVSGEEKTLTATDFVEYIDGGAPVDDVVIYCEGTGITSKSTDENASVTITPIYVSRETVLTLKLTIKLKFGAVSQTQELNYQITVLPAVEITPNYPKPSGTKQLDKEYIKSGTTFNNNILAFFDGTATYGAQDSHRLGLKSVTGKNTDGEYTYGTSSLTWGTTDTPTITITECSNVTFKVGNTTYGQGAPVPTSGGISFSRSTTGERSVITFMVTYKGVSAFYTVEVLDEVYIVETNYQTNNIDSGDFETTTTLNGETTTTYIPVTYEILYVDKTNTSDLFVQDRMVKLQMNNSVTAGVYRFVFKDLEAKTYFVSQNIAILASDAGKVMTYDLGLSMHNKKLYGVYLASDIADSSKFRIENGTLTSVSGEIENLFKTLVNYQENLFVKDKLALVSRLELTYGGAKVDYSKWDCQGSISSNSTLDTISKIDNVVTNPSGVNFTYYYMAKLDVDVDKKATSAQNYLTVNVNEEYDSIVELFGIRHPTTNELVAKSEFNKKKNLSYQLIEVDDAFNKETSEAYSQITFARNTTDKTYLKIDVGKRNADNGVYDFSFLPLGAKNDGNFVLTKLTYKANSFTKDFYIVLQILPDYRVTFNDVENGVEEEVEGNLTLSNSQSIIRITDIDNGNGVYKDFTLLGEDGFLSIKHKNGLNTANELTSSSFKTTITLNQNEYNNKTNFDSKLCQNKDINWEQIAETETYNLKSSKFEKVPQVIFGEQKYYVDLEDDFGYKVRLYFALSLESGVSPSQYSSSVAITEGEGVDITARYESLNIIKGTAAGEGKPTPLTINATYLDPTPTDENSSLKLIEIDGIKAYGFNADYSGDIKYLQAQTDGGYEVNNAYTLDSSMEDYLKLPIIHYVKVTNIKIVDLNGNTLADSILKDNTPLSTSELLCFNGVTFRSVSRMFTMPELDPSVYGAGTSARVIIYIELQYDENGANKEICTVPVNATISRGLTLTDNNSVVKDNQEIVLSEIFTAGKDKKIEDYINDTLEVKVPKGGNVEFELQYTPSGETTSITKSRTISNVGYQYDKTYFVSISGLMGNNVKIGDEFTINLKQGEATFKYRTGSNDESVENFTIATISNDKIIVDDAGLLVRDNYFTQEKYYLVGITPSSEQSADAKYYRVTKTYYVTGSYYKMINTSTNEIDSVLKVGSNSFKDWGLNLRFHDLVISADGKIWMDKTGVFPPNATNLYFEIDKSENKGNYASITNAGANAGALDVEAGFQLDNYVKINIYQIVKGNGTKHFLGSIRLGLKSSN